MIIEDMNMRSNDKFILRKQELVIEISKLITRDGFENLTIRGICKELGISTGSFYHYFPDKGDLIKVLFADIDDYFEHVVSKDFTEDEHQNLITFCENYGIYTVRNGVETCRCISVAPLKTKANIYLENDRAIFQVLHQILQRGSLKEQFHLTQSVEETTNMLLILLRGYSADWAKRNGDYDLVAGIKSFITIFMKSIA